MQTFIIATHNQKKLAELERILLPLGICAKTAEQAGFTLKEVEETGATFEQNARLKAEAAMRQTGLPAVADDSGLVVDALSGAPGVYSARYAGENATDEQRNQKLLHALEGVPEPERTARFVSVVCCAFPGGRPSVPAASARDASLLLPTVTEDLVTIRCFWWEKGPMRNCRMQKRMLSATAAARLPRCSRCSESAAVRKRRRDRYTTGRKSEEYGKTV